MRERKEKFNYECIGDYVGATIGIHSFILCEAEISSVGEGRNMGVGNPVSGCKV